MSSEEIVKFMRSMRSVRRFAPRPVPEDAIRGILEVGRWTGSAKNTQPWELLLVREPATLQALSKLGQFAEHLARAPMAVLLIMNSAANRFDSGRLAERLMLGGWAYGVGSCIASLFPEENEAQAKQLLGVPGDREMRTAISFGYPADVAALRTSSDAGRRSVLPMGRKPLNDLVHLERYGEHII
jgi:nitroreductase